MTGKAYLVGAGPGRADLITVRGLTVLRQADAVLYDRLIAASLLDEAPPYAERIFVGKQPGHHTFCQDGITETLVRLVRNGLQVVRLKGGDPGVFAHLAEEASALAAAGLPFEIVPGVSSALAVPLHAGIPLTWRGIASAFTVVSGHEATPHGCSGISWALLAASPTLVVLMALGRLEQVCAALIAAGRNRDTPAALISRGASADQRVLLATLDSLPAKQQTAQLPSPAVLVVGEVAALANSLAWYDPAQFPANPMLWDDL
ncbi:uroporphyrinogen-III C-methyltransferase [Chloroflexus aggregans]|uniref:uroporphyrinogen-III C-methyltransferase n=1 Tax=Chloroflexus aggregans (strain MD-66 / DSM 9485) TaxID=326427 RepID=B8G7Z2_CHLAD|nr:uroporphyrinogen-III C-methyltransferase [Chloroflexus aggregans]ACL24171.1 uroporphyrin-III C-methyltransferase [Chloroflexus aggregans DSM 9485]